MEVDRKVLPQRGTLADGLWGQASAMDAWQASLPQVLHRAPIPEDDPIPGEEPEPEEDPVPHPDPVVREPGEAPPPLMLLVKPTTNRRGVLQ